MWTAARTTYNDMNKAHSFERLEGSTLVEHLDAHEDNAVVIELLNGSLAIWNAGESYASAMLPASDPGEAETTERDLGAVAALWL